jgi:hypothetical protein
MIEEPASLILELLRQMRAELGDVCSDITQIRADSATKSDLSTLRADISADMHTLRADVAADILSTRKELGEQIMGLRRAVMEYHTSVMVTVRASASSRRACGGSSNIRISPRSTRLKSDRRYVAGLFAARWACCARRRSTILTAITEPS